MTRETTVVLLGTLLLCSGCHYNSANATVQSAPPEPKVLAISAEFLANDGTRLSIGIVGDGVTCAGRFFVPRGFSLRTLLTQANSAASPLRVREGFTDMIRIKRAEMVVFQSRLKDIRPEMDWVLGDGDIVCISPRCAGL